MRRIIQLTLSVLVFTWGTGSAPASDDTDPRYSRPVEEETIQRYQEFESLFRRFIQVVEANLELRRDVKALYAALDQKLRTQEHLTSKDKRALHDQFSEYRKSIRDLERFTDRFNDYSDSKVEFEFPSERPSQRERTEGLPGLVGGTTIHLNPDDDLGRLMIHEIKMWLSAKLLLIDNFVVILLPYVQNTELRRQIDIDAVDPEASYFLKEAANKFRQEENYERTVKIGALVQAILHYEQDNPSVPLALDKDSSYFDTLIEGSYAYRKIPELTFLDRVAVNLAAARTILHDDVFHLSYQAAQEVSARFGNTIGLYEERKGKLYGMPLDERKAVTDQLQLMDILLEKTPFRLTDRFIPGHWGHVAIWVGDSGDIPELKRLGVWDALPGIEADARKHLGYDGPSYQSLIEQDRGVLEALRTGVQLNGFSEFLNVDDLAILRDKNLNDARLKEHLLSAFAQIGKEYDFNFDIATQSKIVCSELVFVVFDDHAWPVEKSVGRYTISPDHVARLALREEDPLAPIVIFHDGKKLPNDQSRENLGRLLERDYDSIAR